MERIKKCGYLDLRFTKNSDYGQKKTFHYCIGYEIVEMANVFIVYTDGGEEYGFKLSEIKSWEFTPYPDDEEEDEDDDGD